MSSRFVTLIMLLTVTLSGCQSPQQTIGALPDSAAAMQVDATATLPSSGRLLGDRPYPAGYERSMLMSFDTPILDPNSNRYRLDTGDVVRIDVFEQAELSRLYRIDGGGFISMPLIGSLAARGMTTSALERAVANGLRHSYLKDPKVSVEISTYRPFFILGEVRTSGQYPYVVGMTVETAVAIAGGYSPRANQTKVEIVRRVDDRLIRTYMPINTEIRPGDTIKVPERLF